MADIVMCRPTFFDVTRRSPTNRLMDPNDPPNKNLAITQWLSLYDSYRRHGLDVRIMEGQPHLEDMTFVANAGLPVRGHFILSNFLEEERRGEKMFDRKYFETIYGLGRVLSLSDEAIFEGQGDALFIDEKTLLLGYGVRTNEWAVEELTSLVYGLDPEITVVSLPFKPMDHYPPDEHIFYHLDTCLLYLRVQSAFVLYPRPFKEEALNKLVKLGGYLDLTAEEAGSFMCNSVVWRDVIFAPDMGQCWAVRDLLNAYGYKVIEHDMSEFLRSGGAVKCLSLEMYN